MMFRSVVAAVLLSLLALNPLKGQCFEIESILVDACGTPEGANEMVLFRVGPAALSTNNLSAVWPNSFNPWLGVCQNANTANKVSQLNAGIQACGLFVEPTNGILPANEQVLLITSEDFDPNAHDFTNLSDTLLIIFQCSGNTGGHFANASGSGLRTLIMGFSSPANCTDTVVYNTQLLIDTNGVAGSGPSTGARNGATVNYTPNGSATYTNDGCQPPYTAPAPNAGNNASFCPGQPVNLGGSVSSGNYPYQWTGGTGSFSNPNSLNPSYIPGAGDTLPFWLYLQEFTSCDTAIDSVLLSPIQPPAVSLGQDLEFCPGTQVVLDAGAGQPGYMWSNGATTQTITVNQPGTYWVSVVNQCFTVTDTIELFYVPSASVDAGPDMTICPGDTFFITSATASLPSVTWSGGLGTFTQPNQLNTAYIPNPVETGSIPLILSVNDTCGVVTDTVYVSIATLAPGTLVFPDTICFEDTLSLSYSGSADSVRWLGAGTFGDSAAFTTTYVPAGSDQGAFRLILVQTSTCGLRRDTLTIYRQPQISVAFSWDEEVVVPGMEVTFFNESSAGTSVQLWDFADGFFSDLESPLHHFSSLGTYGVSLQVVDEFGCTGTLVQSVPVIWGDTVVPNVFSPNGDGINDQLEFVLPPHIYAEIRIFDRWGSLQYVSKDVATAWNGRSGDSDCPEGVYFYTLRSRLLNGDRFDRSGSVTLLR